MAACVGAVIMRPRRAVRPVVAVLVVRVGTIVGVVMTAAFRGLLFPMLVVQGEHTAAEPGDHAEHEEQCEPTAHADQKTPRSASCKPNLAGMGFP
jgi:hypothetical protein